jgi:pyridoxine kinase
MQNTLITVQDLSCVGRCSLSVAMPVLSCLNIQCIPLPSALLSAHTGFSSPFRKPLTGEMNDIFFHFKETLPSVDGIYIGYLAEYEQLTLMNEILSHYDNAHIFIDPVMGDNGKRYSSISERLCNGIAKLCHKADFIFPNLTEAALLLDIPYDNLPNNDALLNMLAEKFGSSVVLTGLVDSNGNIGAHALHDNNTYSAYTKMVPGKFPGTGDLFASVCVAGILQGIDMQCILQLATEFIYSCAKDFSGDSRYGLPFEKKLNKLSNEFFALKNKENN